MLNFTHLGAISYAKILSCCSIRPTSEEVKEKEWFKRHWLMGYLLFGLIIFGQWILIKKLLISALEHESWHLSPTDLNVKWCIWIAFYFTLFTPYSHTYWFTCIINTFFNHLFISCTSYQTIHFQYFFHKIISNNL